MEGCRRSAAQGREATLTAGLRPRLKTVPPQSGWASEYENLMKKFRLLLLAVALCIGCFGQDAVIAPNQNLILQNIPPVPASIAERADRYTDYRVANMFGWHPERREILIGTRFGDTQQVHSVAMPMGARTQMTFFADRVDGASYSPHSSAYFLFRKDVGGGEWYQIYRFDTASGAITLLTDGKSRNEDFRWSNGGDRIAYGSTRRNGADVDFYVMNPSDKSSDKMLTHQSGRRLGSGRLVSR